MAFILAPDHSDRTRVQLSFMALIMIRLFLLSAAEIGFWGRGAEEDSARYGGSSIEHQTAWHPLRGHSKGIPFLRFVDLPFARDVRSNREPA